MRAVVVYSILVRDKGFGAGLQFELFDAAAVKIVKELMA